MKFDKYNRQARVYPAIITLIPFLIFTINCNIDGLNKMFNDLIQVKIIGNITISLVLLYLLSQINRFIGKFVFEKFIYKNELNMPTTRYLLYMDSEFSEQYKNKIKQKIEQDFSISLPTKEDESNNLPESKKRIVEAVGLIRQRVKDGHLLLQHNIEYGFARNLVGGSFVALIVSLIDIIYFCKNGDLIIMYLSMLMMLFYCITISLSKYIVNYLGNSYAKRLFQEYLDYA